jgi:hypothetical protein
MKIVRRFVLNRQPPSLRGNVPNIAGSLPGEARIGQRLQYGNWSAKRDPRARLPDGAIKQSHLRGTQ